MCSYSGVTWLQLNDMTQTPVLVSVRRTDQLWSCTKAQGHINTAFPRYNLTPGAFKVAKARAHRGCCPFSDLPALRKATFCLASDCAVDALNYVLPLESWSWIVHLREDALLRDPYPPFRTASGMTAAVFDNFMTKIGHMEITRRMSRQPALSL